MSEKFCLECSDGVLQLIAVKRDHRVLKCGLCGHKCNEQKFDRRHAGCEKCNGLTLNDGKGVKCSHCGREFNRRGPFDPPKVIIGVVPEREACTPAKPSKTVKKLFTDPAVYMFGRSLYVVWKSLKVGMWTWLELTDEGQPGAEGDFYGTHERAKEAAEAHALSDG